MIDLHTHILPAIDDGARTLQESISIVEFSVLDGVEAIAATPHVRRDYRTTPEQMSESLSNLRRAVAAAGLPIQLLPGAEIALEELDRLSEQELVSFGLAGNPDYLLVEFPYSGWPLRLTRDVERLRASNITPVLAHPERNDQVQLRPARLAPIVRSGALVQLTAASLDGTLGAAARKAAFTLLRERLAHVVSSDLHSLSLGRSSIGSAVVAIDDPPLAGWLTDDVPRAILQGSELPPPPRRRRPFSRAVGRITFD